MPMPTDHVARVSLSEQAYTRIQSAIMDGTLEPGERLRDPDLVEWLGISRTPIRHALDRLHEQGLVEMERNRYTRVARYDIAGVLDAVEVAGDLWAGAALRGMPAWDEDDIRLVAEIAASLRECAADGDSVRFVTIFEHLIVTFAQLEDNAVRIRTLGNVLPQLRRLGRKLAGRIDAESVASFTAALLAAVTERDGRRAVALIDGYVERLAGVLSAI